MHFLRHIGSYENLSLVFIALLMAIGGIYSYKLISFLMPFLTILVIWVQGGVKNISLALSPPFVFLFLLLIWASVGLAWAGNSIPAFKTVLSLGLTFVFSLLLLSCLLKATPQLIAKAYRVMKMAGYLLILFIVVQAFIDTFLIGFLKKGSTSSYMMKPTGLILGLTTFVGCAFLWISKEKLLSLVIFLLIFPLVYITLCQTAMYGLLAGTLMFFLSYAMPFWVTRVAMVFSYTFLILSPLLSVYAYPPSLVLESPLFAWIMNQNLFYRFLGWEFFSKKFFERPFVGWGIESSQYLPSDIHLMHPHNNSIQAYAELGLLGGILYALFFASLFWLVEKNVRDRLSVAVCNATLTVAFVAAEMTHNVWRNYWLSLVTLTVGLIILFLKAREAQLHAEGGHSKQRPTHGTGSVQ